jgi:hypothetical protein
VARRSFFGWLTASALAVALSSGAQEPPAIVAMTIDTSGSIRPELLEQIKQLAIGTLQALPAGSQVAVFAFNDQSTKVLERTSDTAAVQQAVQELQRGGRYTALYDALHDASRYLQEAPLSRKAIVLVTDGLDENSAVQIEDGLKIAVEGKVPVYCVGVGKIQETVLRRIAKLTSGEYWPMTATQPALLAQRIAELPLQAPPARAAAAPAALASTALAAPPADRTWLYVIVGALVVASAFAAAYVVRMRQAAPADSPDDSTGDEEESADRTIVMRNSEVGEVERTLMLKLRPSLTITRGVGQGQVFNLGAETALSIGRAPTNDIPITDSAVSGEHCRIRPENGVYVLHDLKSTNGTFVNEKRVERHRLSEGDVIRVGETHLQFGMGPG